MGIRKVKVGAIGASALLFVCLLSCATSGYHLHGEVPSQDWRLRIQEPDGKPIPGAWAEVLLTGTDDVVSNFLAPQGAGTPPASDAGGSLVVRMRSDGYPMTFVSGWRLLWLVDIITWRHPGFDLRVSAPRHVPERVRLFPDGLSAGAEATVVLRTAEEAD